MTAHTVCCIDDWNGFSYSSWTKDVHHLHVLLSLTLQWLRFTFPGEYSIMITIWASMHGMESFPVLISKMVCKIGWMHQHIVWEQTCLSCDWYIHMFQWNWFQWPLNEIQHLLLPPTKYSISTDCKIHQKVIMAT